MSRRRIYARRCKNSLRNGIWHCQFRISCVDGTFLPLCHRKYVRCPRRRIRTLNFLPTWLFGVFNGLSVVQYPLFKMLTFNSPKHQSTSSSLYVPLHLHHSHTYSYPFSTITSFLSWTRVPYRNCHRYSYVNVVLHRTHLGLTESEAITVT